MVTAEKVLCTSVSSTSEHDCTLNAHMCVYLHIFTISITKKARKKIQGKKKEQLDERHALMHLAT